MLSNDAFLIICIFAFGRDEVTSRGLDKLNKSARALFTRAVILK